MIIEFEYKIPLIEEKPKFLYKQDLQARNKSLKEVKKVSN